MTETNRKVKSASSKKSAEELISGFNGLRAEQRQIAGKIYELDADLTEHKVVIDNLKTVAGDRKCYRMIGGVLVERTVKDVLPDLESNVEQLKKTVDGFNKKLIEKGKEILDYKEKHNIQFQIPEKILEEEESGDDGRPNAGVLVGDKR